MISTNNCLYINNLPRRPRSNVSFTRLLLSHINEDNKYIKDPSLSIPTNETVGNGPLRTLDEKFGIVQVSRSVSLQNVCFITFLSQELAQRFKDKFDDGWRVRGRLIQVEFAHKNSLMGLSITDQDLLQHVLKKRKLRKNETVVANNRVRRKLRRLRFKLRNKGISEQEWSEIVKSLKESKPQLPKPVSKSKTDLPATVRENPPNKILLVQNLPQEATQSELTDLFQSLSLVEIRLVMVRRLAFVEYQSIEGATAIRNKLGSTYDWKNHQINIEFAK